jgi:hypothetical protein
MLRNLLYFLLVGYPSITRLGKDCPLSDHNRRPPHGFARRAPDSLPDAKTYSRELTTPL